jgi:hypothetical protein
MGSPPEPHPTTVDHNAIKFGQVVIVLVVAVAWLAALPALVAVLAAVLLLNVTLGAWGPLRLLYRHVVLPLRIVRPHPVPDDPAPHRFAQGVGGAVLAVAGAAFAAGLPGIAWLLAALVAVLAAVNVLWNFCAGCFLYAQLRRAGLIRRREAT